jgi:flavin reductase (DIM6/NTAB) family NADH-FMN oxidoreductase RutF
MVMRPHTVQRDTLENIKQTGVYTINSVAPNTILEAHQTSARFESDISEFDEVGLTASNSSVVDAPYVRESAIQLSMEVKDIQLLAINQTELVIGQIVEVILPAESIDKTGYVDIESCDSICISGLVSYHSTNRIGRFSYAKPDKPPINLLNK